MSHIAHSYIILDKAFSKRLYVNQIESILNIDNIPAGIQGKNYHIATILKVSEGGVSPV